MKHKHILLFSLLLLISGLHIMAQSNSASDIYVYRNDGKFNAFFADEVDSLAYSNKDLNGIEHPKAVVQEIWTADSVYRIPLSVIDSISATRPETRYKPSVKKLSPDYLPYIESVDSLTISFSKDLPFKLRINKGDILLYEGFEAPFEHGFIGRIKSMQTGTSIVATCETVELTDVYYQYVALGESTVVQDASGISNDPRKERALATVSVPVDISAGALSLNGKFLLSFNIRAKAIIRDGNTYIELSLLDNNDMDLNLSLQSKAEGERRKELGRLPVKLPFVPLLNISLGYASFCSTDIEGSFGLLSAKGSSEYTFTVIYENGKFRHSFNRGNSEMTVSGLDEFNVSGSVWGGFMLCPGIETIGRVVQFEVENKIGPCFEFDISAPSNFNWREDGYDALKNSNLNLSLKAGADLTVRSIFNKCFDTSRPSSFRNPSITISPAIKLFDYTRHIVPEFSDLKIENDTKSITATSTASRELAFPCQVGFSIYDEEDNLVDRIYDDRRYVWDTDRMELNHKFDSNINPGIKYKVKPVVRLGALEMDANPTKEVYLDCEVHTGEALATTYSVEANGTYEKILPGTVQAGFVYTSKRIEPTVDNSMSVEAEITDSQTINGGFSGLEEGTTYYYRAYVFYNDKYYYGETQCITTKKDIDEFEGDNYGGDYKEGHKSFAYTGRAYNIEQKKARIELTFDAITPSTECGYYLEADGKKGQQLVSKYCSLGTVTGNHTVELDDLLPGTKYTYWAMAKNELGTYRGNSRTFETEPSPDPVIAVLEVSDIQMKSANISCYFENIEEAQECGIELTTDDWSYKYPARPGADGKAEVKLPNLLAETDYSVRCYAKTDEGTQYEEKTTEFSTLAPDVTGWYIFSDPQHNGRIFDIELRSNGRTNNFWGVNWMSWTRKGRKLTMQWRSSDPNSHEYWEYSGEFNEDFDYASGKVNMILDSPAHGLYEILVEYDTDFYIRKKQ